MTTKRLTIAAALACIVAYLFRLGARGRAERERYDAWLLSMDADDAWEHGYDLGLNGDDGYWPSYERTEWDHVLGVGPVLRESPEESANWGGWHVGKGERDE